MSSSDGRRDDPPGAFLALWLNALRLRGCTRADRTYADHGSEREKAFRKALTERSFRDDCILAVQRHNRALTNRFGSPRMFLHSLSGLTQGMLNVDTLEIMLHDKRNAALQEQMQPMSFICFWKKLGSFSYYSLPLSRELRIKRCQGDDDLAEQTRTSLIYRGLERKEIQ